GHILNGMSDSLFDVYMNVESAKKLWDSFESKYMAEDSSMEDGSVLYMGDEHFALVHGTGSVALEFSSGKTVTLFNVFYVPKLRKNLVSGLVLNKYGYKQVDEIR
ncbi:hypothetical protein Tco_0884757, partial [Tanacetum coccineum]